MSDRLGVAGGPPSEASTGELVGRAAEQINRLVRDELHLAQTELQHKARAGAVGAGLFGASGAIALLGAGALAAAAVLGLAEVLVPWLAALVVGAALVMVAGLMVALGRHEVGEAIPPVPSQAIDDARRDVRAATEAVRRP